MVHDVSCLCGYIYSYPNIQCVMCTYNEHPPSFLVGALMASLGHRESRPCPSRSIVKPGHLPGVSLSVGHCPDLWPLTFLAEVTNDLGHNPHTQSHLPIEGGEILKKKKMTSWAVVLSCLQRLLRPRQSTRARASCMRSSLLPWSSQVQAFRMPAINYIQLC